MAMVAKVTMVSVLAVPLTTMLADITNLVLWV